MNVADVAVVADWNTVKGPPLSETNTSKLAIPGPPGSLPLQETVKLVAVSVAGSEATLLVGKVVPPVPVLVRLNVAASAKARRGAHGIASGRAIGRGIDARGSTADGGRVAAK